MSDEHEPKTIELVIVYGTNKKLKATDPETIEQVKEGAFGLFGIDLSGWALRAARKDQGREGRTARRGQHRRVLRAAQRPEGDAGLRHTVRRQLDRRDGGMLAEQTAEQPTPEDEAKALAHREYELLVEQSDTYGLANTARGRGRLSRDLRAYREVAGPRLRVEARVRRLRSARGEVGVHRPIPFETADADTPVRPSSIRTAITSTWIMGRCLGSALSATGTTTSAAGTRDGATRRRISTPSTSTW